MRDTLTLYYTLPAADSAAGWGVQAASATEIYGPVSSLSGDVTTSTVALVADQKVSVSWQSGAVLLLVLSLFCYGVYRFGALARAGFKSLLSIDDTVMLFENSTLEFNYFITYGRFLFLLSMAVIVDGLFSANGVGSVIVVGGVVVALMVGSVISALIGRALSWFDYNDQRWVQLRSIKKIDRALTGLIFALPSIAFSYAEGVQVIVIVLIAVVVVFHFVRLIIFFRQRGFSFLQSFLYLCAVEIAPFAFLWGVVSRLNGIHI